MNGLLIALSIIGGILVLLLLALFFGSARVRLSFDGNLAVSISVFGIRKRLFPRTAPNKTLRDVSDCHDPERLLRKEEKKRRKAAAKALKKEQKRKKKKSGAAEPAQKPAPAPNLKENLDMVLALIKRAYTLTKGKVGIEFRKMHLFVATKDAAHTAIFYGIIVQASSYLLQWVEDHFHHIARKEGAVTVQPDFLSETPSAELDIRLSVRLFRALGIGFGMFRAYLAERKRARRRAEKRISDTKA